MEDVVLVLTLFPGNLMNLGKYSSLWTILFMLYAKFSETITMALTSPKCLKAVIKTFLSTVSSNMSNGI